jgi:hypothetical protein
MALETRERRSDDIPISSGTAIAKSRDWEFSLMDVSHVIPNRQSVRTTLRINGFREILIGVPLLI